MPGAFTSPRQDTIRGNLLDTAPFTYPCGIPGDCPESCFGPSTSRTLLGSCPAFSFSRARSCTWLTDPAAPTSLRTRTGAPLTACRSELTTLA